MPVTYTVVRSGDGWTVLEDGEAIERRSYKPDAVEVGQLLTVASRAAGGTATLVVQDGAGRLETWNLDQVDRALERIFVGDPTAGVRSSAGPASSSPTAPSAHA